MIVGEAEIQGQVKRAYELALVEGATGPILNRLFRGALAAGGRARNETAIGERGVSIPSVAVEVAQRALGDLSERKVLMIGAGDTAELVARALVARGVDTVFVANRHHDRALGLAQRFDGEAIRFEDAARAAGRGRRRRLRHQLAAPHHRARRARTGDGRARSAAAAADRHRRAARHRARPAARSPAVSVYDIDDIQQIVERNAGVREAEATRAERIIEAELDRFQRWLASLEVVPTIAALRERGDEVVRRVLAENENRWENLTEADRARMELMAKAIASRILHEPTRRIRRAAGSRRRLPVRQRDARAVRSRRRDRGRGGGRRRRQGDRAASPGQG